MSGRSKKIKSVFAFLLVFGPALALVFISTRGCSHKFQELDDFGLIESDTFQIYNPDTDQFEDYTLNAFDGDIVFITTLQPDCPGNCEIELWHFEQLIYNHIFENKHKKLKQVKVISFLTDHQGNDLKDTSSFIQMKETLQLNLEHYDPSIWMLAKGSVKEIFDVDHNGENLLKSSEEEYGKGAFLKYLLLLDKNQHLRMVLPANKEGEIRVMFEHLALLQKEYSIQNK